MKNSQKTKKKSNEIILYLPISVSTIAKIDKSLAKIVSKKICNNSDTSSKNIMGTIFDTYNFSEESSNSTVREQHNNGAAKKIEKLEKELEEYKELLTASKTFFTENTVTKLNLNLIDEAGETIKLKHTDISCWWCSHQFETLPCFIPRALIDNIYQVFGCFCSFNCAAAYNMNMSDTQSRIRNRHALILKLFHNIFGNDKELIVAPSYLILKKYGGTLSINEFRKSFTCEIKEYMYILPPMTPISTYIEGRTINNPFSKKIKSLSSDDELVLKRSKPLPNEKNNLIHHMGIIKQNY